MNVIAPETGVKYAELLQPYVPRLTIDWLRSDPRSVHRRVAGSLAFVDISGFTRLAERLARMGKVGSEELSDTLDDCFTELLSVAYDYGAGVVKWGGDAVLLLFTGDEHPSRACRAAAEMQRSIRTVGHLRTTAGAVRLRMSVGINTADFHFFLVGGSHRELLLVGPAATETVALEAVAEAGEIVVSDATAAALKARNLGARKGRGVLLRGLPPAEIERSPVLVDVSGIGIEECLPVPIRQHLIAEQREAEHRSIGVAFVEFSGTDDVLRTHGVDGLAEALDECVRVVQGGTERYQVTFHETDIASNGGKILLLSGAPRTAGNEEERMLRAARWIMDEHEGLPIRIGVNCGPVFAGDFGPPYRRTYSVKGDAVNLAARLMAKAAPGQIIAADEVVQRSRTTFELESLEPFLVKGKSKAIIAHGVGAVAGRHGATAQPSFVGRERELDVLLTALEDAQGWTGRFVEIVADPGMGKSRLVQELKSRAERVVVVASASEEYESSTPYFPFRELLSLLLELDRADPEAAESRLRETVAELAPHLLPWLPLLAIPLQIDVGSTPEVDSLDDEFRKIRLEEAVQELLGLGLLAPTLLIFEDVHWMDDASSDLLRRLIEGVEDRPWLIVATRRNVEAGFAAPSNGIMRVIRLDALDDAEASSLAEEVTAQQPLPPHQLAVLIERAGGNPLYLAELVDTATRIGGVDMLPDSVEGVIAVQIDRLPPRERSVLRHAAVLGITFDAALLRSVVPDVPADDPVWQRLASFLIEADGHVRFRHALVRDAAYEGLPYRRRRQLHGLVGETIERSLGEAAEDEAAVLSLHFFQAQRFAEAWRYSRSAGEGAMAMYANAAAATLFERALESGRRLGTTPPLELAAVTESLGDVRVRLGEYHRAGTSYRFARQHAQSDAPETARLMLKEALVQWRQGRHTPALRWIRRGLRTLEGVRGRAAQTQRAQLYAWHGVVRFRQGRALETIDWCRRAIAEAGHADAREALAHAYYVLDYALVALGRYDEAIYSERALAIYEELGDLGEQGGILNNLGMFAYFQGKWDEAIDLYSQAEGAWDRSGDRWLGSFATANRGELLSDQGRLEEAEPLFRSALRVARAAGTGSRIADVTSHYGRLAARAGRFAESHALLEEARTEYEQAGAHAEVLLIDARIAECLAYEGRPAEALALCDSALERATSLAGVFLLVPFLLRLRGWGLLTSGRADEARAVLDESLTRAREKEADYEVALTLDVLADLCRHNGESNGGLEVERDAILKRLGVVAAPVLPAATPAHTWVA
jgi:class 3 adenylate cyclase/tetratricopeptide (TPR) repeat protein